VFTNGYSPGLFLRVKTPSALLSGAVDCEPYTANFTDELRYIGGRIAVAAELAQSRCERRPGLRLAVSLVVVENRFFGIDA
jgi:hypothetical protein